MSPSLTKHVNLSKILNGFLKPMLLYLSLNKSSFSKGSIKVSTGDTKNDCLSSSNTNCSTYTYCSDLSFLLVLSSSGRSIIFLFDFTRIDLNVESTMKPGLNTKSKVSSSTSRISTIPDCSANVPAKISNPSSTKSPALTKILVAAGIESK